MDNAKNLKNLRSCKRCGEAYFGSVDSTMCPECAKASRSANVIRERTCTDCGQAFPGGPRARRCPRCRAAARRESAKAARGNGAARPLGSIDTCQLCGCEYTVKGSRQKYCPSCQRDANLAWQRMHKKEYGKLPEVAQARNNRRKERKKICGYCLRPFWSSTSSNACSDYCRQQQKRLSQAMADVKRGQKRNVQALEDAREEYRSKVLDGHTIKEGK